MFVAAARWQVGNFRPLKLLGLLILLCVLGSSISHAETLNWNYPAANTDITASSSSTTVNGVTITTTGAATAGKFTTNSVLIAPAGSSNGSSIGIIQMAMDANIDDETAFQTTTVQFSERVYNVSFTLVDIDGGSTFSSLWNDIVEFNSDNGRPSGAIVNGTWVSYSSATGRAIAISNQNAATGNANQTFGNITVTFPGPITSFSIKHIAGAVDNTGTGGNETDPANQVVFIDDVTFTRSARLAVQKTSLGGTGTFNFSINNGLTYTAPSTYTYGTTSSSVTTTTAGVAVVGPSSVLGIVNTLTTITETGPTGWELSGTTSTCTDSNFAVSGNPSSFSAAVSGQVVTVAATNVRAGAVITCALSNVQGPRLTLVKTITNNNGGTATTSSFTLSATGPTTISGVSGSANVTNAAVSSGTYALSETNVAGYTASGWSCNAGSLSGNNLTLAAGQTATCTINNNDTGPFLTLIKTVTDTSGGPSTVPSFTLSATGPLTISGITGSAAVTNAAVDVGTYTLAESGPAGYLAGTWSCAGGSQSGNSITVALSQSVTCSINNIKLPTLTITKTSTGGTGAFDFTGTNGVPNQTITTTTAGVTVNGTPATLTAADVATAITEVLGPGATWTLQSANCSGMGTGGTATLTGNTLALNAAATSAGRNISCDFINVLLVPSMAIDKVANTGGPVSVGDLVSYTYTVTNTGNVMINNVSVSDAHNGYGADPVAWSEVLLTDNGTIGDSTDTSTDGVWNTLAPGDVIRFSASYSVVQADIDYLQ